MTMSTQDEAAAKAANEQRRQARENDRKQNEQDIKKARDQQAKLNNEKMERDAKLRPTPTVEEVQQAMAGHHIDNKAPDGSPEQNVHHHVAGPAAQIEVGRKLPETKSESAS